ncbi:CbiX/SirB N-terminal domain-containing protein [Nocardioides sp. GY 10127]|uniref:sirohydrochlorin chelatase n=1 Tax=Nocardioides sp. GY 10127 TaxID=2569762 RepID=UPI0010A78D75|nr:CbiX/SirB N-terminal domain-containing protein [Nocardioides sp. GY 10127]TIC83310.1 sirohydrochlorin chelatase [Nocardioides sp. GY 10127]
MTAAPRLVTVAHGTRRAGGNEVARRLTAAAAERLGVEAVAAYVELSEPLLSDVMRTVSGPVAVVPLLLSTGYHVRHDLPEACALAPAGADVALGRPLGPDPQLALAQVDRLLEAGARPGQPVTMVAAGSTDPLGWRDLRAATRHLIEGWGAEVRLATLAGLGKRPEEVLQPGDAVSLYLLSPGLFSRRVTEAAAAAGAGPVADVLGTHPTAVDVVAGRAAALLGAATSV